MNPLLAYLDPIPIEHRQLGPEFEAVLQERMWHVLPASVGGTAIFYLPYFWGGCPWALVWVGNWAIKKSLCSYRWGIWSF